MNSWFLIVALFNIHTGELNVDSDPVASFKTPKECIQALEKQGVRKPNAKGDVILYECVGPADHPDEHSTVTLVNSA